MTRTQQRFRLAICVLLLDAVLLIALIVLAMMGKQVGGESILFMSAGLALGWGGSVVNYYFGTSESSAQKTEAMAGAMDTPRQVEVVNTPTHPVPVEEGDE